MYVCIMYISSKFFVINEEVSQLLDKVGRLIFIIFISTRVINSPHYYKIMSVSYIYVGKDEREI